jgi:putative spermidine/putrescine transport system substrate-binding protein
LYALQRENLLEKIDYSGFDKAELDQIIPEVVKPYGIGALFFAQAIAYNVKSFPAGNHPRSWSEVFDVKSFPGPRVLYPMDRDPAPLEIALLADGVAAKDLYPLDIERGFRALERIRADVPKWAGRDVDITGMLASGEVAVGQASTGRIASMKAQGAPLDYELNQALLYADMWVIPKGAKNYADTLRFLQFISSAKAQAEFSAIYPNGPVNRGAFQYLTAEQAAKLPNAPDYFSKEIVVNADWWAEVDGSGKTNHDRVVERWNQWIYQK